MTTPNQAPIATSRDYKKLKSLSDYETLDLPSRVTLPFDSANLKCPYPSQMILRMLVRPKYGRSTILPAELQWLRMTLYDLISYDEALTGIKDSWVYVTVRSGMVTSRGDEEWHFDGGSFRTETIPERNYVWCDHSPTEYRSGALTFPPDFDPMKHKLNSFAEKQTYGSETLTGIPREWYLLNPFCLHRRPPSTNDHISRTFVRVSFLDVEIRDVNNTQNPLLPTDAYGRDPVKTFRNDLIEYV